MRVGPRIWSHPDLQTRKARIWVFKAFVLAPIGLLVTWLVVGNIVAWVWERHEDKEWGKISVPLNELPARFDRTSSNPSAAKLTKLALPLGVDLTPDIERATLNTPEFIGDKAIGEALNRSFTELDTGATGSPVLDPAIEKHLVAHQSEMSAVVEHLLIAEIPKWSFSHEKEVEMIFRDSPKPLPVSIGNGYSSFYNLLAYIRLCKLLALGAIRRELSGDRVGSLASLRALNRFSAGYLSETNSVTVLVGISGQRILYATAARLRIVEPEFYSYPVEHVTSQLPLVIEHDVWIQRQAIKRFPAGRFGGFWVRIYALLFKPYIRMLHCRASKNARLIAVHLKSMSYADFDDLNYLDTTSLKPSKSDLLSRINSPSYFSYWRRHVRAALDAESMSKYSAVVMARAKDPEQLWPTAIPGIESSIDHEAKWNYTITSDRRSFSLKFSRHYGWQRMKGPWIPYEFNEAGPVSVKAEIDAHHVEATP